MTFTTIVYERFDRVARITLNRPERANALNQTMLTEIGVALDEAERDPQVRALIVQGGGAAFSSGFDLKEQMERRPTGVAEWEPVLRKDFETVMRFWHSPKRTIAAVRGPCLAASLQQRSQPRPSLPICSDRCRNPNDEHVQGELRSQATGLPEEGASIAMPGRHCRRQPEAA